ncbi:DUF2681 domain-containing protein [Haemophilus haemolyticus]|uniref:DUF2681 domain-containing protein n=1 Tax=Haemophilus haemolyticus TaxID=726 RepID=UPI000E58A476|nr:DUF2681 domain-containing protein [Haemophilus haemolyticus]
MSMQIILAGLGIFTLLGAYVMFKLKHAHREIEQLLKTNAQLQTQKAVAETQVKNFEVRKKNDENTRNTSRDDVINRLQQSGDLRD